MDFSVILLLPNGLNIGFNYFPSDENYDYEEINIYLFIVQLKWRFYYE
jgi:hypothetical protein